MRILNNDNNNRNNNALSRINLKAYIGYLINILITISLLTFFTFIKRKNLNNKNSIYKLSNDTDINSNTNNIIFRKLLNVYNGNYDEKESILNFVKRFLIINKLSKKIYFGKWFTKSSEEKKLYIGDSFDGLSTVNFVKGISSNSKEDGLGILINNYEDNYINHWFNHISFITAKNMELIPNKFNNTFLIKGLFLTEFFYGELLNTKLTRRNCLTNFTFNFQLKTETYFVNISKMDYFNLTFDTIDENKMLEIYLNSSCRFNMSMELYPEGDINHIYYDKRQERIKIIKYVILMGFICLLNILSNIFLISNLKNNHEIANYFPLFYLGFNINWRIFICIMHLNWALTYQDLSNNTYFFEFIMIVFFYLINLIFFDSRFSCLLWDIIRDQTFNRKYFLKRIIYHVYSFIFFFFAFYFGTDIIIFYQFFAIIGFLTWTPQIIFNIIYNNKYFYPIIYIISSSLDKLIFGFYFQGYNSNFFGIKGDKNYVLFWIIYILINIIILFLQYKKGPRFFLGKKCQKEKFNFYRTKKELIFEIKDLDKIECIICLMPILDIEDNQDNINDINNIDNNDIRNNQININKNNNSINSSRSDINIINNELNIVNENKINNKNNEVIILKQNKKKKINLNIKCKNSNSLDIFYKFKKIKASPNKEYMLTPCKHIFHRDCLEKWFLHKKECPNCRNNLSDII